MQPSADSIKPCVALLLLVGLALADAHVVAPPLAAALIVVCRAGPCMATLPQPLPPPQPKSSKRLTRRST